MVAYRCQACGCLHGWVDHPAVRLVQSCTRDLIVAGSLTPGTTGVNVTWPCPGCGATHANIHGERPLRPASRQEIRERAYQLWEADGRPPGDGVRFWLRAEAELQRLPSFEMVRVE